jgi:hypothetical protein
MVDDVLFWRVWDAIGKKEMARLKKNSPGKPVSFFFFL